DGQSDIACYLGPDGRNRAFDGRWALAASSGSRWEHSIVERGPEVPSANGNSVASECFTGDFNGDGRTDVACRYGGPWSPEDLDLGVIGVWAQSRFGPREFVSSRIRLGITATGSPLLD